MGNSSLLQDNNGNAVPLLKPTGGNDYEITVTGTTDVNGTIILEDAVGLYATVDMFIKLGESDVEAASDDYDMFIPAGGYREIKIQNVGGYIAAIKESAADDGTLYIHGLK